MDNKMNAKEQMLILIMQAPVNVYIECNDRNFKDVKFDMIVEDSEIFYSWFAHSRHSIMPVMPLQSTHIVKYFKTLDGAKRNFIRRLRYQERE